MKNSEKSVDDSGESAYENIMTRVSIREYTEQSVPDSIIEKLLRAGMAAPSAANKQPWEFVVVTDQAIKDSIAANIGPAQPAKRCPVAIVVCGNMENVLGGDNVTEGFWIQDCSAVTENILLAAHALGLGAVWLGIYPKNEREQLVREFLNLPEHLVPLDVIALGYPENQLPPKQKWDPAKVHYNRFQ